MGGYPTLTMHNFSFRPDPLNAPKGQEVIRGVDEQVEIFPKRPEPVAEVSKKETPTSLNPAFQSGTLKVKLFGKMKEKNTFENHHASTASAAENNGAKSNDEPMEIEDEEDFELENSPVQPLGNSGVTITPISALNKKRNIHVPTSGSGLELKKMKISGGATLTKKQPRPILGPAANSPFTLGNSSTTITSALESYGNSAAKSMPSVTLTPTGNTGTKKRMNIKNTPLRPIEAQSVVNIAGMKYLVVPHPDPAALKKKKEGSKDDGKLPIILKTNNEDMPSFEVEENSEGKLIIVPLGPKAENARKLLRKPANKLDFTQFNSTLSGGFFAMLHVFKYLKTKERLAASRVCKLWHQISQHPSLWKNLSLKSCRVKDWKCLRNQMNRHGTQKMDLRKLSNASDEVLWTDFATHLVPAAINLTSLELPKIAPKYLYSIVQAAQSSPITNITAINAYNVSCQDEPLDLVPLARLENLQELKLKAASGSLNIDNFSSNLPDFVNLSLQNKLNKLVSITFSRQNA